MITDYTSSTFPFLKPSDVESRRFERVVHRLTIPINCNWSDDEIATLGTSAKSDLVILRSPASRNRLGGVLGSLSGYQTLHADSLLYFSRDLMRALDADQIPGKLHLATDSPVTQQLSRLILATFAAYQNHYSANPSLRRDAVEQGYAEWAASIVASPSGTVLTINDEERPVSFIVVSTFASQTGDRHAEISLNGTHPAYRNKGLYRTLLTHCMRHLASHDVKRLWISTQASHRVMIRTWEKLGLGFELGLNTYHVSPISDY
jgi:ribosomal protein S18 acetylase RimI-like enzyme